MAVTKVYKGINGWIVGDENVPVGKCRLNPNDDETQAEIKGVDNEYRFIKMQPIAEFKKENGDPYTNYLELQTAVKELIGITSFTALTDDQGDPVSVQNPVTINGDSIYLQDIDFTNSNFNGWVGDSENLFKNPSSDSIVNNNAVSPKSIILAFTRTLSASQLGLGENNGGNFSNIKISALGSGGFVRGLYDGSADDTKRSSFNIEAPQELFNKFRIEFYTEDTVSLSNITIQKVAYTVAQLKALNPETGVIENITATGGLLNVFSKDKEYESPENKWGQNDDIDTGTIPESVTDQSDIYTYTDRSTPVLYAASSTNVGDVGELSAELIVVNGSGDFVEEIVSLTLDGQNKVNFTPVSGFLVVACNRAWNSNGASYIGDIYIYEASATISGGIPTISTLIRSIVTIEAGQTRQTPYVIPDIDSVGNVIVEAHILKWIASITKTNTVIADVYFMVQEPNGIMRARDLDTVSNNKSGGYEWGDKAPLKIPTKSRIEIRCINISANNGAIVGKYQLQKVTENEAS